MNVSLIYTESLVRRSVRRFCGRTIGWLYPVVLLMMFTLTCWFLFEGDRSWFVGVMGTVLLLGTLVPVVLYRNQMAVSLAKFHALEGHPVSFRATDEKVTIRAASAASELQWKAITEVWRYPDCWLLLLSRVQFMTFPLEGVPLDAQAFLLERVKANGGRVC